jgi:hypothetical protein
MVILMHYGWYSGALGKYQTGECLSCLRIWVLRLAFVTWESTYTLVRMMDISVRNTVNSSSDFSIIVKGREIVRRVSSWSEGE